MNSRFQMRMKGDQKKSKDFYLPSVPSESLISSKTFGSRVFHRALMQQMLPADIFRNLSRAMQGEEKIRPEYADTIAVAIKEWAVSFGATHYTHWFQPLTGASAEKHDAFIDWNSSDQVIEKFNGKQLLQGEPDASSFPSGGLRSTYEARGYTGWDPASPPFLWEGGDGLTLCIPSVFFSWTGAVLDMKIPLLRSDRELNRAVLRLLKWAGIEADHVYSTLGLEQEYFVIDRGLKELRPDLVLTGRTVCGAPPSKGQELQDHYFGAVKDRILSYMQDFEEAALKIGIPVKTRHNEVAPAQHEIAPVFEKASLAVDHNILLMELMRQTAVKHDLSCLLHEKPFAGVNGSGKHSNWSLLTNTGINLLDPSDTPENQVHFLILLTAILNAIFEHAGLLRASIGSASNDLRLGAHEAPPAIMSVYLGQALETVFTTIEQEGARAASAGKRHYDFGIAMIPDLPQDNTDRNRTSPFAFTGNKFEFRAVGSSSNPAFPITVLNVIVARSLEKILDEIEVQAKGISLKSPEALLEVALPVLRKYLKYSKAVRFEGDNYSEAWIKEAKKRGLPNIHHSIEAFEALKSTATERAFEGVLTKEELASRYDIAMEHYVHHVNIETKVLLEMFFTQGLPAAIEQQKDWARSVQALLALSGFTKRQTLHQQNHLRQLTRTIEEAIQLAEKVEQERKKAEAKPSYQQKAQAFLHRVIPLNQQLRDRMDTLEKTVSDALWPLPKYRELLFFV